MAIDKVVSASIADDAVTSDKVSYNKNQFRNIIINGDMSIAQRGTSTASITSSGYTTIDRFRTSIATLGTWTQSQSTDVPSGQGFAKSLKMDCTTADASPASNDELKIETRLEGQNLQYLKKGTSNAESITMSFWVKSNKTGTYIVEIRDKDNSRDFSKSYTINSADTWEKKTLTYTGDTTGSFDNDNARSVDINFWLGAGSTYTSGTLQSSWYSTTAANRAVGQVNLADSTSNEWYITGIQLEAGTSASDFEFLPFDIQVDRCRRYYETSMNFGTVAQYHGQKTVYGAGTSSFGGASSVVDGNTMKVLKRTTPTYTIYHQDGTSGAVYRIHDAGKITSVSAIHTSAQGFLFAYNGSTAFNQGYGYYYGYTADCEL